MASCWEMAQYTRWNMLYSDLGAGDRGGMEARTGCLFPCSFLEYRVGHTRRRPNKVFALMVSFGSLGTRVRREVMAYSSLSLVSDIGGTLGLFIGFSFFALWDFAESAFKKLLVG